MKEVTMNPEEFYTFKQLAQESNVKFDCKINQGTVTVKADKKVFEKYGY